ncbi:uncharacterized protein LOC126736669 isoform X2 [Anthonomus grandis grandis]|uniref:uncharacterized protein LOC126736669 isoform X2 n=1 Tax=Anthonomus grandis grandis TaxID=2921223 RepID=UPI002165E86F|nr:uncharacterized protein LOC126736669 isoform X2 [Anthonomus grandis grandis]
MEEEPDLPPSKFHYKLRSSLKRSSVNPIENLDVSNEGQNATLAPRRVSFAASAAIKPFVHDPEKNTIWDHSYETSIAHTDSNVASLEVISNVQESNVIESIIDRENIYVKNTSSTLQRAKKRPLKPIELSNITVLQPCEMEITCHDNQQEILMMQHNNTIYQDFEMSMTCNFTNHIFSKADYTQRNQPANVTRLSGSAMDLTCPVPAALIPRVEENLSGDSTMEVTCNFSPKIVVNTAANKVPILPKVSNIIEKPKSVMSDEVIDSNFPILSMEMICESPQNISVNDCPQKNIKTATSHPTQDITEQQKSVEIKPSKATNKIFIDEDTSGEKNIPVPKSSKAQKPILKRTLNNSYDIRSNSESISQQDENCPPKAPIIEDMEVSFAIPEQCNETMELSKIVAFQDVRKSALIEKTWTFEDKVLKSFQEGIKDSNLKVEHFGHIPIAVDSLLEVTLPNVTKPISPCGYNTTLASSLQEKTFDLIQTGQKLTQQEDSICNMKELLVEDIETQDCDFTLLPNISLDKMRSPPQITFCQSREQTQSSMTFFQYSKQQLEESSLSRSVVLPTIEELLSDAFENPPPPPDKINLESFKTLVQTATDSLKTLVSKLELVQMEQSFDPEAFKLPEEISDLTMRLSMNLTQMSPDSSAEKFDDSTVESPDSSNLHRQILKEFSIKDKDIIDLRRSEQNIYIFSLLYGSLLCTAELHPEDGFVMDFRKLSLLTGEQDYFYEVSTLVVGCLMQKLEMSSLRSHLGKHFNMFTLLDFLYIHTEKSIKFYKELMDIQRKYTTFRIHIRNDETVLSFNVLVETPAVHWIVEFKMASEEALQEGSLVVVSKYGEINEEHLQSIFRNTEPGSMCIMRFIDSVVEYFKRMVLPKAVSKMMILFQTY